MSIKKPIIVKVDWIDSATNNSWLSRQAIDNLLEDGLAECQTVGFLVHKTKKMVSIALSRATSDKFVPYADVMSIPRVSITKIKVLK